MKYMFVVSAVMAALLLSACEKTPVVSPPGQVSTPPGGNGLTGSISAPISTSTYPPTDATLPSVKPVTPNDLPTGSQSNANPQGSMTKQEESMAMPKPGQANDHSSSALHPPTK